ESAGRDARSKGLVSVLGHASDLPDVLLRPVALRAREPGAAWACAIGDDVSVVLRGVVRAECQALVLQHHRELQDGSRDGSRRVRADAAGRVNPGRVCSDWQVPASRGWEIAGRYVKAASSRRTPKAFGPAAMPAFSVT